MLTPKLESAPVPQLEGIRTSLHHVGIVVSSELEAGRLMELFGLREEAQGFVDRYQALCVFARGTAGSLVEFVVPSGGVLKDFNGGAGGIHHIALEVDDLVEATELLRARGVELVETSPVKGAGNFLCNFLPPSSRRRFIVELVQLFAE